MKPATGLFTFFSLALLTSSLQAEILPAESLPDLPSSDKVSESDIGKHFAVQLSDGIQKEAVILVGLDFYGRTLSFPTENAPQLRSTFSQAIASCDAKGDGWGMPSIEELRLLSPHARTQDIRYLPGSSWTKTLAPCDACLDAKRFKMAYDIQSGNVRNTYDQPLFKFYPTCVLRK